MATRFKDPVSAAFRRVIDVRSRPLSNELEVFFRGFAQREVRRLRDAGRFDLPQRSEIALRSSVPMQVRKAKPRDVNRLAAILERSGNKMAAQAKRKGLLALGLKPKGLTDADKALFE